MGRKPKDTRTLGCKEIMTVEEAADFLQMRKETILRFIASGELVASRLGRPWRIRRDDLNTFLINKENRNLNKGADSK